MKYVTYARLTGTSFTSGKATREAAGILTRSIISFFILESLSKHFKSKTLEYTEYST